MKKNIIILLFLFTFTAVFHSQAQRHYKPELEIGAKLGTSFSRVSFQPSVKQNMLLGYEGGVSFRYIEEKYFGFLVELNFVQRGWKENFEEDPYSYTHTLNYVELPFMTHIFFGNRHVRGFFNLGPQIGFMISDSYSTNFDIHNLPDFTRKNKVNEIYTMPIKNRVDYGISGGAGIEFRIRKNSILLEGRYYFGLADFYGNRKKDVFASSPNQTISVTLGYMFHLK